jgi:hypothetical protein
MDEAEFRNKTIGRQIIEGLQAAVDMHKHTTYGLCIRHCIGKVLNVDGIVFRRVEGTHKYDAVSTGVHSDLWEMEGTGKQYRITITPTPESHGK